MRKFGFSQISKPILNLITLLFKGRSVDHAELKEFYAELADVLPMLHDFHMLRVSTNKVPLAFKPLVYSYQRSDPKHLEELSMDMFPLSDIDSRDNSALNFLSRGIDESMRTSIEIFFEKWRLGYEEYDFIQGSDYLHTKIDRIKALGKGVTKQTHKRGERYSLTENIYSGAVSGARIATYWQSLLGDDYSERVLPILTSCNIFLMPYLTASMHPQITKPPFLSTKHPHVNISKMRSIQSKLKSSEEDWLPTQRCPISIKPSDEAQAHMQVYLGIMAEDASNPDELKEYANRRIENIGMPISAEWERFIGTARKKYLDPWFNGLTEEGKLILHAGERQILEGDMLESLREMECPVHHSPEL